MVGMIEELEILVVVGVFERPGCNTRLRFLHRLCLSSLQRAVVAAESLSVGIVVVVRAVVGNIKERVVVFDNLLLCGVLGLVVNRESIGLASGILYAARVRTVGGEITYLRHDTLRTGVDMLGVAATLSGYKVRTDLERDLRGVGRAAGEDSIDIELIALT